MPLKSSAVGTDRSCSLDSAFYSNHESYKGSWLDFLSLWCPYSIEIAADSNIPGADGERKPVSAT